MSPSQPPTAQTRPLWIVVAVLLAVGIVVPLLVGIYDQETPVLWGFPFYYWFQFLLIPVVSALTWVAYLIARSNTGREREARGLTPHPEDER